MTEEILNKRALWCLEIQRLEHIIKTGGVQALDVELLTLAKAVNEISNSLLMTQLRVAYRFKDACSNWDTLYAVAVEKMGHATAARLLIGIYKGWP